MSGNEINVLTSNSADILADFSMELSIKTTGIYTESWQQKEASIIYSRILLTYISILRYTPQSKYFTKIIGYKIYDISTQAILTRSLLESYLTLFYLSIENVPEDEKAFRKALWEYHDSAERVRILSLINPVSEKLTLLEKEKEERKKAVKNCSIYKGFELNRQKNLITKDRSKYLDNTEISKRAGISAEYYKSIFKYLSNFTHCSPMGIAQFDATIKKGGSVDYQLFFYIRNIASGIAARSISDYQSLFEDTTVQIPDHIGRIITIWKGIHTWNRSLLDQNELKGSKL